MPPAEDDSDAEPPPIDDDVTDLVWGPPKEEAPPKRRRLQELQGRRTGTGAASSTQGVPKAPPPPAPPLPPPTEGSSEEDVVDLAVAPVPQPKPEPKTHAKARARRDTVPDFHDGIGGLQVRYEGSYDAPGADPGKFLNWQIKCNNPDHKKGCMKKRHVTPLNTKRHGPIEPLAYLHAWVPTPPPPGGTHTCLACKPSQDAVDAFVEAHRGELQALVDRLVG